MTPTTEGLQLKLKGIGQVAHKNKEWLDAAKKAVIRKAAERDEFSADDARFFCGHLVSPTHPNAWGALLNTMARQGLIRRMGYIESSRPAARHRPVSVWKLA